MIHKRLTFSNKISMTFLEILKKCKTKYKEKNRHKTKCFMPVFFISKHITMLKVDLCSCISIKIDTYVSSRAKKHSLFLRSR